MEKKKNGIEKFDAEKMKGRKNKNENLERKKMK